MGLHDAKAGIGRRASLGLGVEPGTRTRPVSVTAVVLQIPQPRTKGEVKAMAVVGYANFPLFHAHIFVYMRWVYFARVFSR